MKILLYVFLAIPFHTFATSPSPIILGSKEEIVFSGGAGDSISCGGKIYSGAIFNIKVTRDSANCDADGNVMQKVFIDGKMVGICTKEAVPKMANIENSFTEFDTLLELPDEEFKKFVNYQSVGNCSFSPPSQVSSNIYDSKGTMRDSFNTFVLETQIELKSPKISEAVTYKALRDFIKAGLCGGYSKERIAANKQNSLRRFGEIGVGFDLFVKKGSTHEQLIAIGYSVAKLKAHGVTLDKFIAAKVPLRNLYEGGFGVKDLLKKFTLKDFVQADLIAELKSNGYKAEALKKEGASLRSLALGGFDPAKDLKSLYSAQDFMAVKDYNGRVYPDEYLRTKMGYSASELKAAGLSLIDLKYAGYSVATDLKPLYSIQEFMKIKDYNGRVFDDKYLKENLGYSAAEMKAAGVSLIDLKYAGFDVPKDLKSLYTIQEFMKVKDYNGRVFDDKYLKDSLGYSASEMKAAGVSLIDMKYAGFDVPKDLKPLYTIQDFMKVKDYNGRVFDDKYLKESLGYSASQMKAAGVSLIDLKYAGFDVANDIKPLYKIEDFIAQKDYNGRVFDNTYLRKTLGYSAQNLKDAGIGLQDLQYAGYDLVKDIKPLYKIEDFIAQKDYNGRVYPNDALRTKLGYSAKELKTAGVALQDLKYACYDLINEIKPLFKLEDFMKVKDYSGRTFPNDVLRKDLGFTVADFKAAGLGIQEIYDSGFTKQQLRDAGYKVEETDGLK